VCVRALTNELNGTIVRQKPIKTEPFERMKKIGKKKLGEGRN